MKLKVFVLLVCCVRLQSVRCSLPDVAPATPPLQVSASVNSYSDILSFLAKNRFSRLPGLCGRLKRRRVTVLCNLEKFCWWGRRQKDQSGQVCRCPRGSRCLHFFVHSL